MAETSFFWSEFTATRRRRTELRPDFAAVALEERDWPRTLGVRGQRKVEPNRADF